MINSKGYNIGQRDVVTCCRYMGDVLCYCGQYGELEADIRQPTTRYRIKHHKRTGVGWSDHNSKRTHTHWIGNKFMLGQI